MKVRILSDLHLEFYKWQPPAVEADVVVLAGDIHVGTQGLEWARHHFPATPVVYVPGNHEFYGEQMQHVLSRLREEGARLGVNVLDTDEVNLHGTRFLGATLWTDFALDGSSPKQIERALAVARNVMHDFRSIRYGTGRRFNPDDSREIHLAQVRWLEAKLAEPHAGATVVITHHLPHRQSIHPKYEGDGANPGFASDLSRLLRPPVSLWIHGHTHESMDYVVNGTRVVCNPRGYLPGEPNPGFKPTLVVEVPQPGRDG
jgi:predicted phosphodiesterase